MDNVMNTSASPREGAASPADEAETADGAPDREQPGLDFPETRPGESGEPGETPLAPDFAAETESPAPAATTPADHEGPAPAQARSSSVYVETARDVLYKPTFNPTTTVDKPMEETLIDPGRAMLDKVYVEPPTWAAAAERVQKALSSEYPLAVVVVRPEIGATTFGKRQLAVVAGDGRSIVLLDGDWQRLMVSQLPRKPGRGQLLELRDGETDQLRESLLAELPRYAAELRELNSFLLITVTEELWSARKAEVPAEIAVFELKDSPPAWPVVRNHIKSRRGEALAADLERRDIARDIKEWSAVRSSRFVRDFLKITAEFDPLVPGQEVDDPKFRSDLVEYADVLKRLVRGWSEELDQRLAEASAPAKTIDGVGRVSALTLEERCYSLVLAVRGSVKVEEAIEEGHRLVDLLSGGTAGGEAATKEKRSDLRGSFAGRGLQTRLKAIGAEVDESGVASFRAAAYGNELLIRVWREYPDVRRRVLEWIMSDSPEQRAEPDGAPIRAIKSVLLATRDTQGLAVLRDLATTPRRRAFAARVLIGAAEDGTLGRPTRALLYDTAARKSEEGQRLVVQVCCELLDEQRDAAMTRIRRVADNGSPTVWGDVLDAFGVALRQENGLPWFVDTLRSVHRRSGATTAVRLGVLALLRADARTLAVVPESNAAEVVRAALDGVFDAPDDYPDLFPTLAAWLERSPSGKPYELALAMVWEAVVNHGRLADFKRLATVLAGVVRADGRRPEQDIMTMVKDDPELLSVVELNKVGE
ncbi:hypothetical protein GCM10009759_46330 [Kitasatospora saccharophila]|uniref:HEAT repeat protein n=1 Tax=Kitasatospora saccharophila TaxID=407973 RepID=A0ABP5IVR0_9ACTN